MALAEGKTKDDARNIAHEAAKAHWNAWAEPLLAQRKALEEAGAWKSSREIPWEPKKGENPETQAWLEKATGNFSRCLFHLRGVEGIKETAGEDKAGDVDSGLPIKSIGLEADRADFSGFIFPGSARFESATFSGDAWFARATFTGDAWFANATFSGDAWFESATFKGIAWLEFATFSGTAWFEFATFSGTAWFESATFTGTARFVIATFTGTAWFEFATFSGTARFEFATFSGTAWFESATFQNSTSYRGAKFEKQASFRGIKVDRAFDMTGAKFEQVPAFNQADFKQAPDLDSVEFPLPFFMGDAELVAKYRAIRRMAIQGADYEREQMAFKGELRSRRWTTDKWRHFGTWFGLLYDGLADCGRSIVRPLLLWQASVVVFAVLYTRLADQPEGFSCGTPFVKALFLSGRNALVLFSGGRDARIAQAYRCLYGGDGEPQIPDSVSFLEAFAQVPISAALIFLLLLAIKNRFKIK